MVAESRDAEANGVAPSFSRLRRIRAVERPDPDLNARFLFTRAAPVSEGPSEADPALGKVMETVEREEASSVTMVRPEGRVVTDAVLEVEGVGVVVGILGNSSTGVKRAENSL